MSAVAQLITLQEHLSALHAPAAEPFLQRAELLFRLGQPDLALRDAHLALLTEPEHPLAQAMLCQLSGMTHRRTDQTKPMAMLSKAEIHAIAVSLLANTFATLTERRAALTALADAPLPVIFATPAAATLRVTIVQRAGDALNINGSLPADSFEPFARVNTAEGELLAIDCHLSRPNTGARHVELRLKDQTRQISIPAPEAPPDVKAPVGAENPAAPLWIIMPVKDGGEVLARCLISLRAALQQLPEARLILVDDCSVTAECRKLLQDQSLMPNTVLLRTPRPMGFTGAVNLGLAHRGRGPVLLLNSDIWLPPNVLPRLLAHLNTAPDVGTVTPLSNNAGGLSLLGPGRSTPLPPPEICAALAEAAWRLQPGLSADLPNGNGFCLLISDPCLAEVGPLSHHYESGYYEEVDFCLRAGLLGYRSIAALDCFVGHAGSVSYGAEKHRLVHVNRRRLHRRFPEYSAEYARFAAADPLAQARERLLAAVADKWQPEAILPEHPGLVAVRESANELDLPLAQDGPILIPLRGQGPSHALLRSTARFARLIIAPENALSAAGLSIRQDHGIWATENGGALEIHNARGTRLHRLDLADTSPHRLGAFEAEIIATVMVEASAGKEQAHAAML